jgi:succinyl-diaminopimelate desuccinylase
MRFNDNWDEEKIKNYFETHLSRICSENNCRFNLKLTFRGYPFQAFNDPFTLHCIKAIKDITGIEAKQDTGGGTSDARFMQRICPVFEFGTINKTLHKVNECVSIDDLNKTEKIYYKTLENFFQS